MTGTLTRFLQERFTELCPSGWTASHETHLLSPDLAKILGYAPRVDLLLTRQNRSHRLWIEFEISRADPVANHAKFATLNLFNPLPPTDAFISMVTSHVARGRHNLAANTIVLMRYLGMAAFQIPLLPGLCGDEVKHLNHLPPSVLAEENLDLEAEITRAIMIAEPVGSLMDFDLHFVGNTLEVLLNLRNWNRDMKNPAHRTAWGNKRRVRYFVFDPHSQDFAPSKFCAYIPIPRFRVQDVANRSWVGAGMTVEDYVAIGQDQNKYFDGNRAWRHLADNLGMKLCSAGQYQAVDEAFDSWLSKMAGVIKVDIKGALFLRLPE